MLTVKLVVVVAAFALTIAEAMGKCPGWVPKILICVALLMECLPAH